MFAYCLNNPVNGSDPCGTCFHRLDFWNDCEKCGGKTIGDKWNDVTAWCADTYETVTSAHQQQAQLQMQITMRQNELIANASKATWDAFQRSYKLEQEAQLLQAQLMLNGVKSVYNLLDETE